MATDQTPDGTDDGNDADQGADLSEEIARKYSKDKLLKLLASRAGTGESLDATVRARYERRFGVDLGHVRIVTGEFAQEFNKQRDAHAVTVGGTGVILMGGSPERSMATAAGQALLGHELAHVAQAKRGLYRAARTDGMPFAEEHDEAEHEAEQVEAEVAAEEAGEGATAAAAAGSSPGADREKSRKLNEAVIERVFEMMAESGRLDEIRGGESSRP